MSFKHFIEDRIIAAVVFFALCLAVWGMLTLFGVKLPEVPKHPSHRRHFESMRVMQEVAGHAIFGAGFP